VRCVKRLAALLLVPMLLVAAAACSKQGSTGVRTGTLRIGLPISPQNLNGILPQNTNEVFVDGLIYSQLVTLDDKGNEVPDLASVVPTLANGGISKDGKTITYHLRTNVKWHDGVRFTSKDVAFTWHAVMNPNNNVVARHGFDQVASVSTPDDATVVFHMKTIFPPAIEALFGESDAPTFILPEHLLAKYPNLNTLAFNASPIGTGPFKFARWLRGQQIVLVANPEYFLGRPKLDQITIELIPDANTTEAELRSHDIDLAFELTGTNFRNFIGDAKFVRTNAHSPSYTAIFFNMDRPPLNDLRVRRALAMAIDRPTMATRDTFGSGSLATADLSPFYWAFDPSLKPVPFDPKAAGALLDSAGWSLGPNGIRTNNGRPFSLQLVYGQGSQTAKTIAEQVQAQLKTVGIDLATKSYDYSVLYAAAQNGGIFNGGNYDVAEYSWISGGDPDDSSQWLANNVPPNGNNVTRYKSAAMDAAQRAALSTFDRAARKRAYARIQQLLLTDVPGTFIYYQGERFVATPDLTGFAPNGINAGWNAYQWSI
jgi:peptide/nickel transport system substrate-binding protein